MLVKTSIFRTFYEGCISSARSSPSLLIFLILDVFDAFLLYFIISHISSYLQIIVFSCHFLFSSSLLQAFGSHGISGICDHQQDVPGASATHHGPPCRDDHGTSGPHLRVGRLLQTAWPWLSSSALKLCTRLLGILSKPSFQIA